MAAAEIEASLLARRLGRWGAKTCCLKTCAAIDEQIALALPPERRWDALLVDYPLAQSMIASGNLAKLDVPRRLVLIRPTERHELPALKAAGFSGYLVKPVRAASLAARMRAEDSFEHSFEPLAAGAADENNAAANTADANGEGKGKGLTILVAEDNEINALLARALLVRLGHRPTIAGNGEAAVESWAAARAAGSPYDLILMDVQMPGMDGLEAARRIRAIEADAGDKPTRIVALTANAQTEDREAALAAGMDGLLVKPLDRERLREALEAVPRPLAA